MICLRGFSGRNITNLPELLPCMDWILLQIMEIIILRPTTNKIPNKGVDGIITKLLVTVAIIIFDFNSKQPK